MRIGDTGTGADEAATESFSGVARVTWRSPSSHGATWGASGGLPVVIIVRTDEDSSGGIRVGDVGGDFTVGSDGSGGIHFERVAGQVHLPD